MRKFILFICFLAVGGTLFAQVPSQVTEITFQVGIFDPTQTSGERPRSPIIPPTVYLENYTLTFEMGHPDYILYIKDEDGNVVFTTPVYSAQMQVVLPSTLSGDYEVELVMGNWLFTGWINL